MKSNFPSITLAAVLTAITLSSQAQPACLESASASIDPNQSSSLNAPTGLGPTLRVAINPQPLPPKGPPGEDRTRSLERDLSLAGGEPPVVVDFWARLRFIG